MGDGPEFEILPDSDTYYRERFPYPLGVRFRRNGRAHTTNNGLDYIGVDLSRGSITDTNHATPSFVCLRMRHTGGSLENGDSVVLYAAYDEGLIPVGWFAVRAVAEGN